MSLRRIGIAKERKMGIMPVGLAITLMAALAVGGASAQSVPLLLNYQGKLTDATGAPLATANYTLTFRLYDASVGGNLIWGPQVFDGAVGVGHGAQVPVVNGHFNVVLGPVDTANASLLSAFNGEPTSRFFEVTIGAGPNPISPRQQVLSLPYSMVAGSVLGGANVFPGSGYVGIGEKPANYPLSVRSNGSAWSARIQNDHSDGGGLVVAGGDGSGTTEVFRVGHSNSATSILQVFEDGTVEVDGNLKVFGGYSTKSENVIYQAEKDGILSGFVEADPDGGGGGAYFLSVKIGPSNPPTSVVAKCRVAANTIFQDQCSFSVPIPRGWYYKPEKTGGWNGNRGVFSWMPLGQ